MQGVGGLWDQHPRPVAEATRVRVRVSWGVAVVIAIAVFEQDAPVRPHHSMAVTPSQATPSHPHLARLRR